MPYRSNADALKRRMAQAERSAVDSVMALAVLEAKQNHGPGAHGRQRFETQTGTLESSIQIVDPAMRRGDETIGRWGSTDVVYARRIELGFQGKDSAGRVVDAPAFPFLQPAAESRYPLLARQIRREFQR